ncbi:MAG: hypothetical protein ACKVOR_09075 [Flavobacteriales bacterium]
MATTVAYFSGIIPASNVTTQYAGTPVQNGPPRTDVSVRINSCFRNANGTCSVYVTVTGANDIVGNMTYIEGNDGLETPLPTGFTVRTGWPGYTNVSSVFCVTFDVSTGFPPSVLVEAGAKGGAGNPTGFTFAKTKKEDEEVIMKTDSATA